jgi:hypothetical protein
VLQEDEISSFNWRRDVCDAQIVPIHVMDANGSSEHVWNRATSGSRPLGRQTFRVVPEAGSGHRVAPRPSSCYLTITHPYWLKNAKCGVTLHRIR